MRSTRRAAAGRSRGPPRTRSAPGAARIAADRARAEAAERGGDHETALVLWEVLARDLPGDASIRVRSERARAAVAARAQADVLAESGRRVAESLAALAREALARGDVEEAAGLTRALGGSAAAGDAADSLERRVAWERDRPPTGRSRAPIRCARRAGCSRRRGGGARPPAARTIPARPRSGRRSKAGSARTRARRRRSRAGSRRSRPCTRRPSPSTKGAPPTPPGP